MNVTQSTIQQLVITDADRLDPVKVMIENLRPGAGNITITCFGKSWTSYWGSMSDRSIQEFFVDCNDSYLINCLERGIHSVLDGTDNDANIDFVKGRICKLRRDLELSADEAREYWDEADGSENVKMRCCDYTYRSPLLSLFGDDPWYAGWPTVPNPDYEYLKRIVQTVREAIKQTLTIPA